MDRRQPPLDKACGEGLMPYGVSALEDMGVELPQSGCVPFVGVRYIDGDTVAEGRFRGRPGLGIRRTILVASLLARGRALGVEVRFGCAVEGWVGSQDRVRVQTTGGELDGRLLVAADGLLSGIRRQAGLAGRGRWRDGRRERYGVRRHYAVDPWSEFVEVYLADGVEAYVTPVGPELVGVALLWTRGGGPDRAGAAAQSAAEAVGPKGTEAAEARFARLLGRFPPLCERLAGGSPATRPRGSGPFRQRIRRRYADGVALVGDAAGYLDALTGEGLALGFVGARALVEVVASGHHLSSYEAAYRRLSRRHFRGTALLLRVAARPSLRRRAVALLAERPSLFDRLLAWLGGAGSRRRSGKPLPAVTRSS